MNGATSKLVISIDRSDARTIIAGCLIVIVVLVSLSVVSSMLYAHLEHGSRMAYRLFSVDEENSIPTWWATATLGFLAIQSAAVGNIVARNRRESGTFLVLAAGFIFLSMDEAAMLHERAGYLVDMAGIYHHARWIVIWLPAGIVCGGIIMISLWRISRRYVIGLFLGAIVFIAGAVGVETINSGLRLTPEAGLSSVEFNERRLEETAERQRDRLTNGYIIGSTIEELLEMLGVVIWIAATFDVGFRGRESPDVRRACSNNP